MENRIVDVEDSSSAETKIGLLGCIVTNFRIERSRS